ncbi:LysR family transcriptional regulator [Comamonas humi]
MDRFDQYRIFVQVADQGSFIQAARALDLPRASVTAAVQQLEAHMGVRLLHRTTRKVSLSADGARLMQRLQPLLQELEDVDQLFHTSRSQVSGQLRVDLPSRIARRLVAPALPGLLAQHPQLQLHVGSTDRAIDLVEEGVDCVVRIGMLDDSSLVVHRLGCIELINCASPAYLQAHGEPLHPDELPDGHLAIGYGAPQAGRRAPWEWVDGAGQLQTVELASRVAVNNVETYIAACRAGLGLIQIPRYDVQHLLDAGRLAEVMPGHRAAPMPVSLLYPHRRHRSRRLAAFIDWFGALMAPHLCG